MENHDREPVVAPQQPRNGLGSAAVTAGVVALLFGFVPVAGDFIALPASLIAVVTGAGGVIRADKGTATNWGASFTGLMLGLASLLIMFVMFTVSQM